jgi:integrase
MAGTPAGSKDVEVSSAANKTWRSSIFLGKDGRWHGWITMAATVDGVRTRRHVSHKTRAVVEAKVRDAERERSRTASTNDEATVAAWFAHWLDTICAARVRARTLDGYRSLTVRHVLPTLGHRRLDQLEPDDLETLYADLLARGLSPNSVLRVHRVISRSLKVAHQRELVRRDVSRLVEAPRPHRSEIARPLSLPDARAVLAAAASERNAPRWSVALALGLRQSEALALRWSDIDLIGGTLTVRRSVHRVRGRGLVYEEPKTAKSRRTLALPAELLFALRDHQAAQLRERTEAGRAWQDNDLLFAQPDGRPIDRHADYAAWTALLRAAGVDHVRLHDARHTAATLLLAENVHPRVVMELLGHSQMRTTVDTYSHVMPALARDASERLGAVLLADVPRGAAAARD